MFQNMRWKHRKAFRRNWAYVSALLIQMLQIMSLNARTFNIHCKFYSIAFYSSYIKSNWSTMESIHFSGPRQKRLSKKTRSFKYPGTSRQSFRRSHCTCVLYRYNQQAKWTLRSWKRCLVILRFCQCDGSLSTS